jgi:type I restriction enzyme S subunit
MVQTIKTMSTATTHIKTEKQLVPELRFKEFEGDFELSKLGNELNLFNGYAFSSKDSSDKGVRWVKIADVGINKMKLDAPSFLPSEFAKKHSKFILHKGDYVIALTRPILGGKLKIAKINVAFDGSLLNQRVGKLESKNDLEYMYCMLQQKSLISRIENRIAGTDPPNLSPNEIATLKTFIPTLPEQQKIASFLSAVDEKIQQLTKKKALLEDYKKGVMQRLFCPNHDSLDLHDEQDYKSEKNQENLINPKKSRLRPLRFKDENGNPYPDWEEKRLDKLFTYRNGGRFEDDVSDDGAINLISLNSVDIEGNLKLTQKKVNINIRETDKMLSKGELVMVLSDVAHGNFLGLSAIIPENDKYVLNYRMGALKAKEELNSFFIAQLINHNQRYFKLHGQGSSQLNLTKADVLQFAPPMPCIEEQQKIATYLSGIDTKIESVNNQITKNQTFKKGLLQQMFV